MLQEENRENTQSYQKKKKFKTASHPTYNHL